MNKDSEILSLRESKQHETERAIELMGQIKKLQAELDATNKRVQQAELEANGYFDNWQQAKAECDSETKWAKHYHDEWEKCRDERDVAMRRSNAWHALSWQYRNCYDDAFDDAIESSNECVDLRAERDAAKEDARALARGIQVNRTIINDWLIGDGDGNSSMNELTEKILPQMCDALAKLNREHGAKYLEGK